VGVWDRIAEGFGAALGSGVEAFRKATVSAARQPYGGDSAPPRSAVVQRTPMPPTPTNEDPRGLLWDPFALIDQLGYRDKPSGLTYSTLREMAVRVPQYTAIVQTRVTQVKSFGQRQRDPYEPGFGITLRDPKKRPSKAELRYAWDMEDWLLHTGSVTNFSRDSFKIFLSKLVRDALNLDQATFEIQHNRQGKPWAFYAMDGGSMRLADTPISDIFDPQAVRYVQVYDEMVIGEYLPHQLCFGVRNPRTDLRVNGYGFSELEMLINVVTASLWAFEYNKRAFSQGANAKGLLNFKGTVPDEKVEDFRRRWQMMVQGVGNAHRTPMINVDEVQWVDLNRTNAEMEYGAWMDWLMKITCAVCQFDPAEANFNYGNAGQQSQMFSSPVGEKLQGSKDRGLRPLLDDIADWLNHYLIWPLNPDFEFQFLGLSGKTAKDAVELAQTETKFKKTVNEIRAEDDLPPLEDGDVILDPSYIQAQGQRKQMEAMQQQGGPDQDQEGSEDGPQGGNPAVGEDDGSGFGYDEAFGKSLAEKRRARVRVYEIEL
jgi:Phage portal protein